MNSPMRPNASSIITCTLLLVGRGSIGSCQARQPVKQGALVCEQVWKKSVDSS